MRHLSPGERAAANGAASQQRQAQRPAGSAIPLSATPPGVSGSSGSAQEPQLAAVAAATAAAGDKWYFVDLKGTRHGPVAPNALLNAFERGRLTVQSLVWQKSLGPRWQPFIAVTPLQLLLRLRRPQVRHAPPRTVDCLHD